jgi:hypothetical protein
MGDSPAAILYDSSGNEKGVAANPVQVGVIPNPTDVTGTITALNGVVAAAVQGWGSCAVVLTGTWNAVLVFEWSSDGGSTWTFGGFVAVQSGSTIPLISGYAAANGTYQTIGMGPTTNVRVRAAAFTSGTVNVRLVFSDAPAALTTSFSQIVQNVISSSYNSSVANLASLASFTGTSESTLGVAGIRVNIKSDQPILLKVEQSQDGTNWDILDEQIYDGAIGDGRTYQATASYFRIIATNLGPATTTYFRLQTALCPTVEALPRALTPNGRLRLASQTSSWVPDPANRQDNSQHRALRMDVVRNLCVRGQVLTDEASFRDDFTALYTDLTGTFYFTNGSVYVTGVGTAFKSQINNQQYIKISSHADSAYVLVEQVISDTLLILDSAYTGATASGTGRASLWMYAIGSGGAITQASSEILLASGTTNGTLVQAKRTGDYLPYVVVCKARITQRIANQESHLGLSNGDIGAVTQQALVVFDGTTNTTVKFRTSFSASDVEETTVTLPGGAVTSSSNTYQIEVFGHKACLFINGTRVAEHTLHIPGSYAPMELHFCIKNTGVAGSTTTFASDVFYFSNFDQLQVGTMGKGDPVSVKELRASMATPSNVSAAAADTLLLAANSNRMGATVTNDSVATLYLKLGTGASPTSHTAQIPRGGYYEVPFGYTGQINGYWSAATGTARVTEIT